jgi:hypothetical protein
MNGEANSGGLGSIRWLIVCDILRYACPLRAIIPVAAMPN